MKYRRGKRHAMHTGRISLLVTVADLGAVFYRFYDRVHSLSQTVFDGVPIRSGYPGISDLCQPEKHFIPDLTMMADRDVLTS